MLKGGYLWIVVQIWNILIFLLKQLKNLDPSYKVDLDFEDCLRREINPSDSRFCVVVVYCFTSTLNI